ncbi:hypothetical protein KIW84_054569 [Lathyrus oleraceus]|uniref:Uncharacterized protein n=1 Tax=Pisum sativum TaxID=3888 RepID=A0A9D4WW59_PEA|nr:hypothetical protein KIW84_054569 [Pisum sativum]
MLMILEAMQMQCYDAMRDLRDKIGVLQTPYELWKNLKPNISYFHLFGCSGFMLNTKENLRKFDSKAPKFHDKLDSEKSKLVEKLTDMEIAYSGSEGKTSEAKETKAKDYEAPQLEVIEAQTPMRRHKQISSSSEELILGDKSELVRHKSSFKPSKETLMSLVSLIVPTSIDESLMDT